MKISQSFSLNQTHTRARALRARARAQHGNPLSIFSFYEEKKGGNQQTINEDN